MARFKRAKKKASRPSKRIKSPSKATIQRDLQEIKRAIKTIRRVSGLPRVKSILKSLTSEQRKAERLLQGGPQKPVKARAVTAATKKVPVKRPPPPPPSKRQQERKTTKGEKIARGWRFVKAIKENYSNDPNVAKLSLPEIRSEYKKFRDGHETSVPDIAWYNPSP